MQKCARVAKISFSSSLVSEVASMAASAVSRGKGVEVLITTLMGPPVVGATYYIKQTFSDSRQVGSETAYGEMLEVLPGP